jgi:hypothetical protein
MLLYRHQPPQKTEHKRTERCVVVVKEAPMTRAAEVLNAVERLAWWTKAEQARVNSMMMVNMNNDVMGGMLQSAVFMTAPSCAEGTGKKQSMTGRILGSQSHDGIKGEASRCSAPSFFNGAC